MKPNLLQLFVLLFACGFAGSILSGCTETELHAVAGNGIAFSDDVVTRLMETDLNKDGKTFGVYGYKSYDESVFYPVFENQKVIYQNGGWTYTPVRYWDAECGYQFFAYSPARTQGVNIDSRGLFSVENFDAVSGQDLLIAEPVSRPKGVYSPIQLNFKHVLANVSVRIRQMHWDGTVKMESFRIAGMKTAGSYIQGAEKEWTAAAGNYSGNFYSLSAPVTLFTDGRYVDVLPDQLMIPQEVNGNLNIRFELSYTCQNETYSRSLVLAMNELYYPWVSGKKITYTLTVSPAVISFGKPEVEEWVNGDGQNVVVTPQ